LLVEKAGLAKENPFDRRLGIASFSVDGTILLY
jgi:hypothetical protein